MRFKTSWIAGRVQEYSKLSLVLCTLFMGSCLTLDSEKNLERQPQVHEVEIKKFKFKPETLSIYPGDLVRWTNKDIVPHRVSDANRKKWVSHDMVPNDSFSKRFMISTTYICVLHPGMKAKIVLLEDSVKVR